MYIAPGRVRCDVFLTLPNLNEPHRTTPYENIKPKPHSTIVQVENPRRDSVLHREKHSRKRTSSALQRQIFSYNIFWSVSGHRGSCQHCFSMSRAHHHHGRHNHRHYDKYNGIDQLCFFSQVYANGLCFLLPAPETASFPTLK